MITTMDVIYQKALLADAAYVKFHSPEFLVTSQIGLAAWDQGGAGQVSFESRGFTRSQFDEFQRTYRVLHHQPDTSSGFSATLFENVFSGELHLSFRGSNDAMDVLQDAVLATSIAGQFGDWLQNGAVEGFLRDSGLVDASSGGVKSEYAGRINLSGHSLQLEYNRGHETLWNSRAVGKAASAGNPFVQNGQKPAQP